MSTGSTIKSAMPSILGGIASFLSPWFESWKERRNHRRELIALWKSELLDSSLYFDLTDEQKGPGLCVADSKTGIVNPETSHARLIRVPSYATLRPYLSKTASTELKRYASRGKITLVLGPTDNLVRQIVASEIHRLEKLWKLI
jgi:hypothetical protein